MIYRFGDWELDTARAELRRGGMRHNIEAQVFDVLQLLIENRDRVVSNAELFDTIWAGRVVSDSALSSRIKSARRAIGDDGRGQTLIRTVRKKGFRFVADVTPIDTAAPLADRQPVPAIGSAPIELVAPPAQPAQVNNERSSLAVLPFAAIGDLDTRQVLADGLVHDIITRIGRTRWLAVTARGTAFRFRNQTGDPVAAAGRLGVRYLAHGNVQFSGSRVRVQATLVDVACGFEIWSEHYDRVLGDILAIQEDIADAIVGALRSEIQRLEQRRALIKSIDNLDAWEAYHRGCWHMYRLTADHFDQAKYFFELSRRLAPGAPQPYAGLSFVHWQRAFLDLCGDCESETRQAFDYARRCLDLDPSNPQGRCALGRAYQLRGKLEQSEQELEQAVALNPSSVMALFSLGRSQLYMSQSVTSMRLVEQCRRLSPFDPMTYAFASVHCANLLRLRCYDEAVRLADISARQANAQNHIHILALAAVAHISADRESSARKYLNRLHHIRPNYGVDDYLRAFPYQQEDDIAEVRRAFEMLGATKSAVHKTISRFATTSRYHA